MKKEKKDEKKRKKGLGSLIRFFALIGIIFYLVKKHLGKSGETAPEPKKDLSKK